MAYIGREPQIGNFQVCDAISVVDAQAAYTMQVDTVDVSPESANHMIVSLNGVIQKPTDAYTVSGSTITFASNLVTGDVIDFIQILGNVLDLGVPSDSTVSLAKLTATGTKDATTFLRGDNTFQTVSSYTNSDALTLFNASGSAPVYACRAWVNFDGTGTPAIRASGNVSSITDTATGTYQVNFTTAMTDANYVCVASVNFDTGGSSINVDRGNQTTALAFIEVRNAAQTADADRAYIHVAIFR
jgi:hypothetical protein